MSHGYSHCDIVADLWSAPSFVFLKNYQGISSESLLEFLSVSSDAWVRIPLLSPCEDNLPPLGYLDSQSQEKRIPLLSPCRDTLLPLSCVDDQNDEKRISLRDRDRLRNDRHWVPGFLSCYSWMFPERLRNKSELVDSEETRQVLTEHPRYETLSY